VPALIAALHHEDLTVRCHVAEALGSIACDANEAVPALITTLEDPYAIVRDAAQSALQAITQ